MTNPTKSAVMTPHRVTPETLERFKQQAQRLNMSGGDFIEWLLDATEDTVKFEERLMKEYK